MSENTIIIKDGIKTLVDIREYITDVVIPNSVISIEAGAFNGCTAIVDIELPCSIKNIDNQ